MSLRDLSPLVITTIFFHLHKCSWCVRFYLLSSKQKIHHSIPLILLVYFTLLWKIPRLHKIFNFWFLTDIHIFVLLILFGYFQEIPGHLHVCTSRVLHILWALCIKNKYTEFCVVSWFVKYSFYLLFIRFLPYVKLLGRNFLNFIGTKSWYLWHLWNDIASSFT